MIDDLDLHYVFFDIDETLVMPNTTFIYGLPNTDTFLTNIKQHEYLSQYYNYITTKMENEYYDSNIIVVNSNLPNLINYLRQHTQGVFGLTSRYFNFEHNQQLFEGMRKFGINFTRLSQTSLDNLFSNKNVTNCVDLRNISDIGTIIFRTNVCKNKWKIISKFTHYLQNNRNTDHYNKAILVDNTKSKCINALEYAKLSKFPLCLKVFQYIEAFDKQKDLNEMQQRVCQYLDEKDLSCIN